MGNLFSKKTKYKQLTFGPYVEYDNRIIESSLEYHEYNDIQGLQEQIDNIKQHYNIVLNTRLINIEDSIAEIKDDYITLKGKFTNLSELSDMQSRDLESLLNNDNVLLGKIKMLEEKVQYDQFVNSDVDNFLSINEEN